MIWFFNTHPYYIVILIILYQIIIIINKTVIRVKRIYKNLKEIHNSLKVSLYTCNQKKKKFHLKSIAI